MADTDAGSRERLVVGAADMIRRRGFNATSVRELAKHAGAPLGSTYHYFPGGKQQVATEAVEFAGEVVSRRLAAELRVGAGGRPARVPGVVAGSRRGKPRRMPGAGCVGRGTPR